MRVLTRLWQMLLKALEEVSVAPNAMMAAEMAIIRLTHVADLPDPETLIRKVQAAQAAGEFAAGGNGSGGSGGGPRAAAPVAAPPAPRPADAVARGAGSGMVAASGAATALAHDPAPQLAGLPDWEAVLALISRMRDVKLLMDVEHFVRLARYTPGRIEFQPAPDAPRDLAQRLAERLRGWTGGARWAVTLVNAGGAPTVAEARAAKAAAEAEAAAAGPRVQALLAAFPGARIAAVRPAPRVEPAAEPVPGEAAVQVDAGEGPVAPAEEWDPFEDED